MATKSENMRIRGHVLMWTGGLLLLAGIALPLGPGTAPQAQAAGQQRDHIASFDWIWSDAESVSVLHDNATGCEYVRHSDGGLVPRMRVSGERVVQKCGEIDDPPGVSYDDYRR